MDTDAAMTRWSGRDLTWLNAERGRLYCGAAGLVFVGVLAGTLLWGLTAGYTGGGLPFGMDFTSFWAASRLIWAGMATSAYVPQLHKLAEMVVIPPAQYEAFFYPPPYLLLCAPLAALPFFWSMSAFMSVTGIAFGVAVSRAAVSAWVVLAALVSPASLTNLVVGQNAMLTAALLGGGLTLMDRRPRLAGAILGLMVIKPHLALAVPIALVLSRRWTVLGFALLSALALMGLSTAVFGWGIWPAFLASTTHSRHALEAGLVQFHLFQSTFAAAQMLGCDVPSAYVLQGLTTGVALGTLVWTRVRHVSPAVERSVIVLASLLSTPFILHYDLLILMFPSVWLLTQWSEEGFPPWGKLALLILYLLPIAIFAFPDEHIGLAGMLGLTAYLMFLEWHSAQREQPSIRQSVPIRRANPAVVGLKR